MDSRIFNKKHTNTNTRVVQPIKKIRCSKLCNLKADGDVFERARHKVSLTSRSFKRSRNHQQQQQGEKTEQVRYKTWECANHIPSNNDKFYLACINSILKTRKFWGSRRIVGCAQGGSYQDR